MYLLDTNVVSELRKPKPHGAVLDWLSKTRSDRLFLSAIVLGEIQAGIEKTRTQDALRAAELEQWLEAVSNTYEVLPLDGPVCRRWALLMAGKSRDLMEDAFVAATAQVHGLTVATRNEKDFQLFNIPILNPFQNTSTIQ